MTDPPDPPARPGPLGPVLSGLLVKDPARRLTAEQAERLLRRVAERAIGVFPVPRLRTPRPVNARSTRFAAVAAAFLLAGAGGAAVIRSRDASPPPPAAVASAGGADPAECTAADGGSAVTGTAEQSDFSLPEGWLWHTDATGNRVAVPQDWTQSVAGNESCFRDPDSGRSLTVGAGVRPTGSATAHWQQAEQASMGAGSLPGYRRLALTSRPDGAQWEFTWQPAAGPRLHEMRTLVSGGRGYVVDWSTPDTEWSINLPYLRLVLASLNR